MCNVEHICFALVAISHPHDSHDIPIAAQGLIVIVSTADTLSTRFIAFRRGAKGESGLGNWCLQPDHANTEDTGLEATHAQGTMADERIGTKSSEKCVTLAKNLL